MNIYLIGAMGSGKSTTGKRLAAKLGWQFRDIDAMIEEKDGMPVGEIFSTRGEEYFRKRELETVAGLAEKTDIVVSCGGGTPCFYDNMEVMKASGIVVYLKMPPEALVRRLEPARDTRPLIKSLSGGELFEKISSLLKEREVFYEKAHIVVNGLSVNLNGLVEEIRLLLNRKDRIQS